MSVKAKKLQHAAFLRKCDKFTVLSSPLPLVFIREFSLYVRFSGCIYRRLTFVSRLFIRIKGAENVFTKLHRKNIFTNLEQHRVSLTSSVTLLSHSLKGAALTDLAILLRKIKFCYSNIRFRLLRLRYCPQALSKAHCSAPQQLFLSQARCRSYG